MCRTRNFEIFKYPGYKMLLYFARYLIWRTDSWKRYLRENRINYLSSFTPKCRNLRKNSRICASDEIGQIPNRATDAQNLGHLHPLVKNQEQLVLSHSCRSQLRRSVSPGTRTNLTRKLTSAHLTRVFFPHGAQSGYNL